MNTVFIYTLREPGGPIRYIGKTKDCLTRLKWHLKEARRHKARAHKNHWIRSLLAKNEMPLIEVIDEVEETDWQERERFWISWFRKMGFNLVNGTDGGEGVHNPSPQTRLHMSEAHKGKGRPQPESAKIKLRAARLGKPLSLAHRKKLSEAHKGIPQSVESRRKRSEWLIKNHPMRGKKHSPEALEKMKQAHGQGEQNARFGTHHSEETKEKIRAGRLRHEERKRSASGNA